MNLRKILTIVVIAVMAPVIAQADPVLLFGFGDGDPRFATHPWNGTYDAQSRLFTIVGDLDDSLRFSDRTRVDDVSGFMFLSALIDHDGRVSTGALSVIGMIPSLGITSEGLLMAGEVTALSIFNFVGPNSRLWDPVTQALIKLDFALPELGFGEYAGFQG